MSRISRISLAAAFLSIPFAAHAQVALTLQGAQDRAVAASKMAELAKLNVTAARYHRQAAQADYFPKISSNFVNMHFNKFMGQQIPIANRSLSVPLLNKDQSLFAVTVTQPITPLFQVNQAVKLARADERIAQAKAAAAAAAIASTVQNAYYAVLISQKQQVVAQAAMQTAEQQVQIASRETPALAASLVSRQAALNTASKALITANSKVAEATQSLNTLMGLPADTVLELAPPPPVEEVDNEEQAPPAASIERNPDVVEAREGVEKARAAVSLAKLSYMPEVAGLWGYSYQTAISLLPHDFSFVGFVASWNVFDWGKRENTIRERATQVRMAETNLDLVRGKVSSATNRAALDLKRTQRILQLARQVVSMQEKLATENDSDGKASRAQAEAEMFQAELEYRLAAADWKRSIAAH